MPNQNLNSTHTELRLIPQNRLLQRLTYHFRRKSVLKENHVSLEDEPIPKRKYATSPILLIYWHDKLHQFKGISSMTSKLKAKCTKSSFMGPLSIFWTLNGLHLMLYFKIRFNHFIKPVVLKEDRFHFTSIYITPGQNCNELWCHLKPLIPHSTIQLVSESENTIFQNDYSAPTSYS